MKNWYASRTMWTAAALIVLAGLNAATGVIKDPMVLSCIGVAIGIIQGYLRTQTKTALK